MENDYRAEALRYKENLRKVADAVEYHFHLEDFWEEENFGAFLLLLANEITERMEREAREAAEQDSWETRYYHERDYGGRL